MSSYFSYSSYTNNKINTLENQLNNKADISYVDVCFNTLENQLNNKADISYVDACFNLINGQDNSIFFIDTSNIINNSSFENDLQYWSANDINNISVIDKYIDIRSDYLDNFGDISYTGDGTGRIGVAIAINKSGNIIVSTNNVSISSNEGKYFIHMYNETTNNWNTVKNNIRISGTNNKFGVSIDITDFYGTNNNLFSVVFGSVNGGFRVIEFTVNGSYTNITNTRNKYSKSEVYDSLSSNVSIKVDGSILYIAGGRSNNELAYYNFDTSEIARTKTIAFPILKVLLFGGHDDYTFFVLTSTNVYIYYYDIATGFIVVSKNIDIQERYGKNIRSGYIYDTTIGNFIFNERYYTTFRFAITTTDKKIYTFKLYKTTVRTYDYEQENDNNYINHINNNDLIDVKIVNSGNTMITTDISGYIVFYDYLNNKWVYRKNFYVNPYNNTILESSINEEGNRIIFRTPFSGEQKIIYANNIEQKFYTLIGNETNVLEMKPTILIQNQTIIKDAIYNLNFNASAIDINSFNDFSLNIRFANDTTSQEIFSKTFTENDIYLDSSNNYVLNNFSGNDISANDNYNKLEIEVSSSDTTLEKLFVDNIQLIEKNTILKKEKKISKNVTFNTSEYEYILSNITDIADISNISFTIIDDGNGENIGTGGTYYIKYNSDNTISLMRTITTNSESWNCDFYIYYS